MAEEYMDINVVKGMLAEEAMPTGGYIGQVVFCLGWKVYVSGMNNEQTTFLTPTAAEKAAKKMVAQKVLDEHPQPLKPGQKSPRPRFSWIHILLKNSVLNYDGAAGWEGDRYFVTETWTEPGKIILENVTKFGLKLSTSPQWAWIRTAEDPYRDKNGNPRMEKGKAADGTESEYPARYWYIAEVFPSKEKAMEKVGEIGSSVVDVSDVPDEWLRTSADHKVTAKAWEDTKPEIVTIFLKKTAGKPGVPAITNAAMVECATEFGVTPEDVAKVVGVAFTGKYEAHTVN